MRATALSSMLGIIAALSASGALAEDVQLKGDQLAGSISGKTYTGATQRGGTWETSYSPDGTFEVRVLNSSWSDSGTWEIKDDRICSERSKRSYMCYEVLRVSDDEYHWIDERGETQVSSGPK